MERLLLVVFPAAERTPMSPVNRPEGPFARSSPVQAPTHGGGPAMVAESAAVPVGTADDCAAVQAEAADVAAAQASKAADVAAMQEEMVKFSAGVQEKMAEFSAMQEKMAEFTAVQAKMAEFSAGMQAKMAELSGMQAKMAELAAMQENMRDSAAIQSEMPDLSAMQAEMTEYSAALTKMAELAPTQAQVGKSQMAEFAAMQPEIAGMQAKIEALERDNKDLLGKVCGTPFLHQRQQRCRACALRRGSSFYIYRCVLYAYPLHVGRSHHMSRHHIRLRRFSPRCSSSAWPSTASVTVLR